MKIRDFEWWIIGILGLTSFLLAIIGFNILFTTAGIERNFIDLAFQSVKIFGMEFVDDFQSPLPWQLELARWLAPGVVLYTAGKAIYYFIRREFKSVLIKYKRDHIIITTLNPKSRYLISDLLAQKEKVIVVAGIEELQKIDLTEKEGAVIVDGEISSYKFLRNIAAHRAKYFVFIDNDDEKNISSAISVYNYLVKFGKDKKQTLFTHVSDDLKLNELKDLGFFEEFTEKNMLNLNCEIRIFSANERTSRVLLNKFSPDVFTKVYTPEDPQLRIAIIGSKNLAQSMVIRFARLGYFANLKKLKITLFYEGKSMVAKLKQNFKGIENLIDLELVENALELFDTVQFDAFHKNHPFSAIYLLCENDSLSSSILKKLTKVETSKNMDVILSLLNPDGILSKWYTAKKIDSINLHKFNLVEESFTKDALISEKLDVLAKIIHNDYLNKLEKEEPGKVSHQPWELLPPDFKNQNREQADHLFVKLRAIGFEKNLNELLDNISNEKLELLAEMEHNRWWAHMVLDGWTLAEKRNDHKKQHTDLKPYAELPEAT
jgi:hypothetical protein